MPWLGCSAILDPVILAEVRDLSKFDLSVCIQYTSIDRPDIKFAIRAIQYPENSFHNLEFLVEPVQAAVEQIIKKKKREYSKRGIQKQR